MGTILGPINVYFSNSDKVNTALKEIVCSDGHFVAFRCASRLFVPPVEVDRFSARFDRSIPSRSSPHGFSVTKLLS
jgi:hypothetical protein